MECYFGGKHNGKLKHVLQKYNESEFFDLSKNELSELNRYHIIDNIDVIIKECIKNNMIYDDIISLFQDYHILIGNDVLNGVVPIDKEIRNLRDDIGIIYQKLARKSDKVYKVQYGIETKLKPSRELVVSTDCAGSIGEKENDTIAVDYETLAYLTTRNVLIESITKSASIEHVMYSNFCGDEFLGSLRKGMEKALGEAAINCDISGSTESNFVMKESAFTVSVVGYKEENLKEAFSRYAVVGLPLVGEEVLKYHNEVITIGEVINLMKHKKVSKVLQIGSKGVNDRAMSVLGKSFVSNEIDLNKSAGPSTCVLVECEDVKILKDIVSKQITEIKRG